MVRRIPSLNQLRAFEATARHLSFKEGARELCVTQAAVSHQIKALEEVLGQKLFHRGVRQVSLTLEAEAFAKVLTEAFDSISSAAQNFTGAQFAGRLSISVAPFFANRWLLPRLLKFRAKYPEIDLKVDLSFDMVELDGPNFDAAVRYGHGEWPGLTSIQIYRDIVGPVCAPQYLADRKLPLTAEEISHLALATSADLSHDWADWLAAAGVKETGGINLIEFTNGAYSFDAALSGNAVCLTDIRTTAADEAAGNLVRLHPLMIERAKGIYLVFADGHGPRLREHAFAEWMRQEAENPTLYMAPKPL